VRIALVLLVAGCASAGDVPATADAPVVPDAPDLSPDAPGAPDVPELAPLYPSDRTQSPLTEVVAAHLRDVAARAAEDDKVFAKVGDSITVEPVFMGCFAGAGVNLDGRTELQPTIDWFAGGDAGGTTPYQRVSLAAKIGASAPWVLAGTPPPLDQEVGAIHPRFALVMYGTNDAEGGAIFTFAATMLDIVDRLEAQGVIPILSSVPPNDQSATADARVPRYNLVVRGIAQGRRLPFVDFWRELEPLPNHGLAGDGVHPQSFGGGCAFTPTGLSYGYNVRNLISIQALARARAALSGGAPDAAAPALAGAGSKASPFVVPFVPFVDLRDTSGSPNRDFDVYGCSPQNESGPEYVYRLTLAAPATIRATVFVRGSVDVDVQLLQGDTCLARDDREITYAAGAGTYVLTADTFVPADGIPRAGEYLLTVATEQP
jgi:hypothetical protein